MTFFALLSRVVKSENITNREFLRESDYFSGDWEIGYDASLKDQGIQLLSGKKKLSGGAYMVGRIKDKQWASEITLKFNNTGETIKQFGIWFTSDYREEPYVFGGPLIFHGAAILSHYNGSHVFSELRFNNKTTNKFIQMSFFPTVEAKVENKKLTTRIEYDNQILNITYITGNKSIQAFNEKVPYDLHKHYLSCTAANYKENSTLQLISAYIHPDPKCDFNYVVQTQGFNDAPKSNKILKPQMSKETATAVEVIEEVLSWGPFVDGISTKKDVRALIDKSMLPFAESWQRRSIVMMQNTSHLKHVLTDEMKATTEGFSLIYNDITKEMKNLKEYQADLERDLYYGIMDFYNFNKDIGRSSGATISHVLMLIGILEVSALIIFIVLKFVYNFITER